MKTEDQDVQGYFLGMPYDFRRPSLGKLKRRFWSKEDDRVFTPMAFGWGYAFNLYQLGRKLGVLDR